MPEDQTRIEVELARIATRLDLIDKHMEGLLPLSERVALAEHQLRAMSSLPKRVIEQHERTSIDEAIDDERIRARDELRSNLTSIVGLASLVASVITALGAGVAWMMASGRL